MMSSKWSVLETMSSSARIDLAIEYLKEFPHESLRNCGRIFNCHHSSISGRIKELHQSADLYYTSRQKLSPQEEACLVKWATQYSAWGLPLQIKTLNQFALEILRRRVPDGMIGKNWYLSFLNRNPQLKIKLSRPRDYNRHIACDPTQVKEYLDLLHKLVKDYNIQPENKWNMDEKGEMMGVMGRFDVLIPKEQKEAIIVQDGKRDWVSVIEAISAGCKNLPAFLIFKAKFLRQDWMNALTDKQAMICVSDKGWTDSELAMIWLKEHFEPLTRPATPETYRLLILDGHESHCSIEFIEFSVEHKIILLVLPSHTTHMLQPLDVAIFGPLSQAMTQAREDHTRNNGMWVSKEDFVKMYEWAKEQAITPENIRAAFSATSIEPWEPRVVLDKIPIRPLTPPREMAVTAQGNPELRFEILKNDIDTKERVTEFLRRFLTDTDLHTCEDMLQGMRADNAILFKANCDLVAASRRRGKKTGKKITGARWLNKETAEQLREEERAKEQAKEDKAAETAKKKADTAVKKAQAQAAKEDRALERAYKAECRRLGSIHLRVFS